MDCAILLGDASESVALQFRDCTFANNSCDLYPCISKGANSVPPAHCLIENIVHFCEKSSSLTLDFSRRTILAYTANARGRRMSQRRIPCSFHYALLQSDREECAGQLLREETPNSTKHFVRSDVSGVMIGAGFITSAKNDMYTR